MLRTSVTSRSHWGTSSKKGDLEPRFSPTQPNPINPITPPPTQGAPYAVSPHGGCPHRGALPKIDPEASSETRRATDDAADERRRERYGERYGESDEDGDTGRDGERRNGRTPPCASWNLPWSKTSGVGTIPPPAEPPVRPGYGVVSYFTSKHRVGLVNFLTAGHLAQPSGGAVVCIANAPRASVRVCGGCGVVAGLSRRFRGPRSSRGDRRRVGRGRGRWARGSTAGWPSHGRTAE
jgi:hypothetical protein